VATKIGDLYFDITAQTSDVDRAVGAIAESFGTRLSFAASAAAQTVETALRRIMLGVGRVTAEVIDMGAEFNIAGQSATASFSSIYRDAGIAYDILSDINELQLDSPLRGLGRAARTLAGFGVEANAVVPMVEALATAVAAMGLGSEALDRVALAFGQIASRGRLAGDEARQLANYGIDAYGLLAERLGMTVAEIRELGKQGRLFADDVLPILVESINERFGDAAQNLFNTYAGQLAGLRAITEGIGSALVEPFIGFASGGVVVEVLGAVRAELRDLVTIAGDGGFRLRGALAPLEELSEFLAGGFRSVGLGLADLLGQLEADDVQRVVDTIISMLARGGPIIARFARGVVDLFGDMYDSARGFIPEVTEFLGVMYELGEEALPLVADIIDAIVSIQFERFGIVLSIISDLARIFGPALIAALEAFAFGMEILADIVEVVAPYLDEVALALGAVAVVLSGPLVTALALASAGLVTFSGFVKGLKGDMSILEKDFGWLDPRKYLQELPAELGIKIGQIFGGSSKEEIIAHQRALEDLASVLDRARQEAEDFADNANMTELLARELHIQQNLPEDSDVRRFWQEAIDARKAYLESIRADTELQRWRAIADAYEERHNAAVKYKERMLEELDLLRELEDAAAAAWRQVDRLSRAGEGATVDDFLRSLPGLAQDLTDALRQDAGILRDLEIGGVLGNVRKQALDVIRDLAEEYGLTVDEIESLFDERGLSAVIGELTGLVEENVRAIDPLIVKYGSVSTEVDLIRDALQRLENQRTTSLQAQIDQVEAALRDARDAADKAREAIERFFAGDSGGLQGAIDEIVLAIPGIGDQIEEGLLKGGPQGEALVRQALGDLGADLSAVFSAGIAEGLSVEEIMALLGPVFGSIDQEVRGAANRITSLDWTEGFTPQTAEDIQEWLAGVLDPATLEDMFSTLTNSESAISGLEAQLEDLRAQLRVDVEFSPEQVQAAIGEIHAEIETTPLVTPEAADLLEEEIQKALDDNELRVAIDEAVALQEANNIAKLIEDNTLIELRTLLIFDPDDLINKANGVSEIFGSAFSAFLRERLRSDWNVSDTPVQPQQPSVDDFMARAAELGITGGVNNNNNVNINNQITVNESGSPRQTASEIIAASSAAAGSGGRLDPSKWYRGNMRPV
jgi:tape measure domain-containing protein